MGVKLPTTTFLVVVLCMSSCILPAFATQYAILSFVNNAPKVSQITNAAQRLALRHVHANSSLPGARNLSLYVELSDSSVQNADYRLKYDEMPDVQVISEVSGLAEVRPDALACYARKVPHFPYLTGDESSSDVPFNIPVMPGAGCAITALLTYFQQQFHWSRIGLIQNGDSVAWLPALPSLIKDAGFELASTEIFPNNDNAARRRGLQYLRDRNVNIILALVFYNSDLPNLYEDLFALGMLGNRRFLLVCVNPSDPGRSVMFPSELYRGHFTIRQAVQPNSFYDYWLEQLQTVDPTLTSVPQIMHLAYYDNVWLVARALDAVVARNETVNGSNLLHEMKLLRFQGVTGLISGLHMCTWHIMQYTDTGEVEVARYDESMSENVSDRLTIFKPKSELIWPDGSHTVPNDNHCVDNACLLPGMSLQPSYYPSRMVLAAVVATVSAWVSIILIEHTTRESDKGTAFAFTLLSALSLSLGGVWPLVLIMLGSLDLPVVIEIAPLWPFVCFIIAFVPVLCTLTVYFVWLPCSCVGQTPMYTTPSGNSETFFSHVKDIVASASPFDLLAVVSMSFACCGVHWVATQGLVMQAVISYEWWIVVLGVCLSLLCCAPAMLLFLRSVTWWRHFSVPFLALTMFTPELCFTIAMRFSYAASAPSFLGTFGSDLLLLIGITCSAVLAAVFMGLNVFKLNLSRTRLAHEIAISAHKNRIAYIEILLKQQHTEMLLQQIELINTCRPVVDSRVDSDVSLSDNLMNPVVPSFIHISKRPSLTNSSSSTTTPLLDPVSKPPGPIEVNPSMLNMPDQKPSILHLLEHPVSFEIVKDVCVRRMCVEMPLFVLQVQKYRRLKQRSQLVDRAERLLSTFLSPGAKYELNLEHACVDYIRKTVASGKIDVYLFDAAEHEVVELISANVMQELQATGMYSFCVRVLNTHKVSANALDSLNQFLEDAKKERPI